MNTLLIRSLTKMSSYVQESKTTNSTYFTIGDTIVRVSDHDSNRDSYDLAIITSVRGYVLIPNIGSFKQFQVVRNVDSVTKYITHFNYFKNVFLGKTVNPAAEDLVIDVEGEMSEFFNNPKISGWLCKATQPENIQLLAKLHNYYTKNNNLDTLIDALKLYNGLNAERKHDYLSKMCQKLML